MSPFVILVTNILSFFTVLLGIIVLLLLWALIFRKRNQSAERIYAFFSDYSVLFSMLLAWGAVLGSLFYSEFANFAPCTLCWWQRVFIYPQAVIFLVMWIKKERIFNLSALVLSCVGWIFSLYNTYLQFGGSALGACGTETAISCARRYFLTFGYVTIPTMSLTLFTLLILFAVFAKKNQK